jgi:hypothetical protein
MNFDADADEKADGMIGHFKVLKYSLVISEILKFLKLKMTSLKRSMIDGKVVS